MANISSKIKSIEPEDDVVLSAMDSEAGKTKLKPGSEVPVRGEKNPGGIEESVLRPGDVDPVKSGGAPLQNIHAATDNIIAPSFGWITGVITLAAILWIATALLIAYSFFDLGSGLSQLTPLQWAGLALFITGPILMLGVTGYALKQLAQLSVQAHRLSQTAETLITPDETVLSRTSIMSRGLRSEIDHVNNRVDTALSRVGALQDTLEAQAKYIDGISYATEERTEIIAKRLSEEREALIAIAATFDDRMSDLSVNLDSHTANLAKSTKEAEQRIQEARVSVEGATARINAASETVRENTIDAATKLEANQEEIARLSENLKTRAEELDAIYTKHASDLAAMISDLRDEQENLGISLEARLEKMRDMSLSAQVSAQHLTEASKSGRETVVALADAARLTDSAVKQRFAAMEDMVRYSNARAESISEKAARRVQESVAQTRKEIARIEYDMVALQDRLSNHPGMPVYDKGDVALGNNPAASPVTELEPEHDAAPQPKRRKLAGLKPLPDEKPELQTEPENPPVEARAETKQRSRLSGLRPAPQPEETFESPVSNKSADFDEEDFILDQAMLIESDLIIPDERTADIEDNQPHMHDLVVEMPAIEDLIEPDPDAVITSFDPDLLRRPVPNGDDKRKARAQDAEKSSWIKRLFGGKDADTTAIDTLTADVAPARSTPEAYPVQHKPSDAEIVKSLSAIGLAPAAIVDDGCIIEAVNTRISRGPLAMSDVITHRLEDPVRHLFEAAEKDPELRENMSEFARRFHTSLGSIEDERETIRARFESDAGRAFLLCDAALNR